LAFWRLGVHFLCCDSAAPEKNVCANYRTHRTSIRLIKSKNLADSKMSPLARGGIGMKLPLREFADIIAALKGVAEKAGANEKRGAARMTICAKLDAYLLRNDELVRTFSVLTRDISITGIGLLQGVAVSSDQRIVLQLPRGLQEPLCMVCRVMHCRPLADGIAAVGMEYIEKATQQIAKSILSNDLQERQRISQSVLQ
jgi:hypothetical protein